MKIDSLFIPTHALIYTLKHQLTLIFKTLKNPDNSSRHTHKPTAMTYSHILHRHSTNVHRRDPVQ